jgi:hypothetical protein
MYTNYETSKQKQAFWTAFGRYMKPILSADGEAVNWINYKTGKKHVHFKMDADHRLAEVAIVLDDPDQEGRHLVFGRLLNLKPIFEETVGESDWIWSPDEADDQGRPVSIVLKKLDGVNVLKNEDWPAIISFLKPRIIALDSFWSLVRYTTVVPLYQ